MAILWVSGSKEQNYGSGNEFYNTNDGFELVKVSIKSLLKINAFYIFIVLIEIKFRVEFAAVCNSQIARMITIRYCVTSISILTCTLEDRFATFWVCVYSVE